MLAEFHKGFYFVTVNYPLTILAACRIDMTCDFSPLHDLVNKIACSKGRAKFMLTFKEHWKSSIFCFIVSLILKTLAL